MMSQGPRFNLLRPKTSPLFLAGLTSLALLAHPSAQAAESPLLFAQNGTKNRIIFDYSETPTPRPSPTSVPKPAVATPTPAPVIATPTPTPAPTATPTPEPIFAPTPEPTPVLPEPTPEPTPEPIPTPEPTPEPIAQATPEALPSPTPESTPDAIATSTPEPTPEAVAQATPEATPTPEAPRQASAPATGPEGALPTEPTTDIVSDTPSLAPTEPPSPSQSVTINLINKLVQRGILTKEDASDMIKQAEAEAETARQVAQSDMFAIAQVAASQAAADQIAVAQVANAPAGADDVRVTYIPEPVKTQIKEEIKLELATQRPGSFATGLQLPAWVGRTRPFADLRLRFENTTFPNSNDSSGAFPNFNSINTNSTPFDTSGTQFAPQLNADQNRNRFRIRARFGADLDIGENFFMGFRVATGDNNNPVSTNQSLGAASSATQGQGGNFSKYAIWLDRAFVRYDFGTGTKLNATAWVGRFDNPFFSTPLIWDDDLGFDGFAARIKYEVLPGLTPFVTGGAFPVYNTDFNFSSNQPQKFESYDKYLFAIQGGLEWKPTPDWNVKVAAAYYYFQNIEGKLSTPYTPITSNDAGDTDNSRPSFAQKGNTYMALRDIIPDATNDFGAINQWQYYGLATKFQNVAVTARIDYNGFEPVQVSIVSEWVTNLAFNKDDINLIAVNNRGPLLDDDLSSTIGQFDGSPNAWYVEARIGTPALAKRWDWNVAFGYRWVGSDAVVDGFNDSDFGLGGTNIKGFTVGGSVSLSQNVWLTLRWMGADSIAGPTYKSNIIQLDINSRF